LRLCGQLQMGEDADDSDSVLNGRDQLQSPITMRATLNIDIKHALEQMSSTHVVAGAIAPGCF